MSKSADAPSTAEPFVIVQASGMEIGQQKQAWFQEQAEAGKAKGVTFARFSYHPEQTDVVLFEGWADRPEDQGATRFNLETINGR